MTKEELAEIKEWIESEEKWDILGPDWEQLVCNLLVEIERLQSLLAEVYTVINDTGDLDELVGIFERAQWRG